MSHTLAIDFPEPLLERLRRVSGPKPLEGLVVNAIEGALPNIGADLPNDIREAMEALETLPDDELVRVAKSRLPADETPREYESGDASDKLMLCKAYALVLLKWRGIRLTMDDLGRGWASTCRWNFAKS